MLLSTDWFLPFWSEIGICVDDAKKADIHEGCRAIVRRFMGDRGNYFQIDFTDKRRQETESLLIDLLGRLGAGYVRFVLEKEGSGSNKDEMSTGIMSSILAHDLLLRDEGTAGPVLDDAIRTGVIEAIVAYDVDPNQFSRISVESDSTWDVYVSGLLAETPGTLSNIAFFAAQEIRLKALWRRICERLSEKQRVDLICWYRIMAASRGIPINPVPSFIS